MILFKKMKTMKKQLVWSYLITLLVYLISLIFFTKSIFSLVGIETPIRILLISLFIIFFFLYLLGGALTIVNRKKNIYIVISIIMLIFAVGLSFGSFYINKAFNTINKSSAKDKVEYTTNLVVMKDYDFLKSEETKVGMISHEDDIEGHVLAKKLITKENLTNIDTVLYDNYIEMLNDLYSGEIDGTFLSGNYIAMFNDEENFENIDNETEVIYTYSELLDNKDAIKSSGKELTEPFSLLIIGVDSTSDSMNSSQAFNGDTLMLITFNPDTLSSVVFSIPRDTYVPISCRNNAPAKINSSAYGGTACVINTIQNLTNIDIDYYVKVNFRGVVDLVDALNGIEIDIPIKFCEQDSQRRWGQHQLCLDKGLQTINGEEALAFARHRKTLPLSDFQRVQNQQLVVEAAAKKGSKIRSINDFYKVLDAVSRNIETNMSSTQMLSFYEVGKNMLKNSLNGDDFISIEKTYLTGYSKYIYSAYTYQYYKSSLEEITNIMKVNLGLEEPKLIKTFSFSGNDPYEIKVHGKVYETPPVDTSRNQKTEVEDKVDTPINDEEVKEIPKTVEPIEKDDEVEDETPKNTELPSEFTPPIEKEDGINNEKENQ